MTGVGFQEIASRPSVAVALYPDSNTFNANFLHKSVGRDAKNTANL